MTWKDLRELLACWHRDGRHYQDYGYPYIYEFACADCPYWYTNTVSSPRSPQVDWADWLIDGWLRGSQSMADW